MDALTISAVVPTCGRPGFLRAAVRSVLAQRLRPTELLIVDDGAGGGVTQVVRELPRAERIRVHLVEGPGRGPAAARNAALRRAAGELVAFLDDDDLWLPDKLARQVGWFARRAELALLGTGCVRTRNPAAASRRARPAARRPRPVSLRALVHANRLVASSVVARRACFEECGGFDESLALAQDWDMWIRIAENRQVGLVPERLTVHRLHDGQRSADALAMRAREAEVVSRALARGRLSGLEMGVARRRLAWAHFRLGRMLGREGDRVAAIEELKQAIALSPCHPAIWGALARSVLARAGRMEARPE